VVSYILHELVPPLGRFHQRNAAALEITLLLLYFVVAGAFVYGAVRSNAFDEGLFNVVGVVVTLPLLLWALRRGTSADRLPLLMLAVIGTAGVTFFLSGLDTGDLKVGAWVGTAGWLLATILKIAESRGSASVPERPPSITH
jgi:hypothetical protein